MTVLYFFADTNLFIQCRPLHELDWTRWAEFDEVHILVSHPVQREIDNRVREMFGGEWERLRDKALAITESIIRKEALQAIAERRPSQA